MSGRKEMNDKVRQFVDVFVEDGLAAHSIAIPSQIFHNPQAYSQPSRAQGDGVAAFGCSQFEGNVRINLVLLYIHTGVSQEISGNGVTIGAVVGQSCRRDHQPFADRMTDRTGSDAHEGYSGACDPRSQ